jgi:hypothetical protein
VSETLDVICKLCGGETQIRTTPYTRYRDCLSCGESWAIETVKVPPYTGQSDDDIHDIKEVEPDQDELIHELGG